MVEPVQLKILENLPNDDLVHDLEQLLRRAKAGQFVAFAFCGLTGDHSVYHWTYLNDRRLEIMGALASLSSDLATAMGDGAMPPVPPEEPEKDPA